MGGAQAIAALAYGTESVAPVDVIVGPGQRLRAGGQAPGRRATVGIDGIAGPSELRRRRRRAAPTRSSSRSTCSPRPSTAPDSLARG